MQVTSTFWAATQPLPRAERATIPHMKEEMQGFHMNQISEIFFGEKALFSALSQSKSAAPRTVAPPMKFEFPALFSAVRWPIGPISEICVARHGPDTS